VTVKRTCFAALTYQRSATDARSNRGVATNITCSSGDRRREQIFVSPGKCSRFNRFLDPAKSLVRLQTTGFGSERGRSETRSTCCAVALGRQRGPVSGDGLSKVDAAVS